MADNQRSRMSQREGLGYIVVAALLMAALIAIAIMGQDDSKREFDLSIRNLSNATLGVPKN